MLKKIMIISLAVIMAVAVTVGCQPASTPTPTTEPTLEPTLTPEASLDEYFYDYEAFNMGGRNITIATWDAGGNFSSTDAEPDPVTATEKNLLMYNNLKRIEEKYNVQITFEVVPLGEMASKLTTTMNSGKAYCDIVRLSETQFVSAVLGKQILSMDEYVSPDADVLNGQYYVMKRAPVFGKDFMAFSKQYAKGDIAFLGFNQSIIDDYGLANPAELYAESNWTWDAFYEIAKAATKDIDQDGENDTFGFSGLMVSFPCFLECAIASNGGFVFDDINMREGFTDPKTMEAFEFTKKIHKTESLTREYKDDLSNDWTKPWLWYDGKTAMFLIAPWMMPSSADLTFEWHAVPFPVGPSNPDHDNYKSFIHHVDGYAMVSDAEEPTKVWQIFEDYNAWFGTDLEVARAGDVAWLEGSMFSEEDIQMVMDISASEPIPAFYMGVPDFPYWDISWDYFPTDKSISASVEAFKAKAQDAINTMAESLQD